MKLAEIKNMNKNELLEYLDLYGIEAYPDESKRKLLVKAVDLFWSLKDNDGFILVPKLSIFKKIRQRAE